MTQSDRTLTLSLSRERGNRYLLLGSTQPAGFDLSSWRSRAQAWVASQPYQLTMSGVLNRTADARRAEGEHPIVRIGRKSCVLPTTGAVTWTVHSRWRGYEATLQSAGRDEIEVRLGRRKWQPIDIEVRGNWPARDLVVLTAAFALLVRRRDDDSAAVGAVCVG
jgi:hypothetical protein